MEIFLKLMFFSIEKHLYTFLRYSLKKKDEWKSNIFLVIKWNWKSIWCLYIINFRSKLIIKKLEKN